MNDFLLVSELRLAKDFFCSTLDRFKPPLQVSESGSGHQKTIVAVDSFGVDQHEACSNSDDSRLSTQFLLRMRKKYKKAPMAYHIWWKHSPKADA